MDHRVLETESLSCHYQVPGRGRDWRELASEHALASSQAFQDGALYQAVRGGGGGGGGCVHVCDIIYIPEDYEAIKLMCMNKKQGRETVPSGH